MTEAMDDVVEELKVLRQREIQAIGAAISTRNWHDLEAAYNQARDRLDRNILPAALAKLAPADAGEGLVEELKALTPAWRWTDKVGDGRRAYAVSDDLMNRILSALKGTTND